MMSIPYIIFGFFVGFCVGILLDKKWKINI